MFDDPIDQYSEYSNILNTASEQSKEFARAVREIKKLALNGLFEAVGIISEILALNKKFYDPELAYFFYNIYYGEQYSYKLEFNNVSADPLCYLGELGDFRNENVVAHLIDQIGLSKCRLLDARAEAWRKKYSV